MPLIDLTLDTCPTLCRQEKQLLPVVVKLTLVKDQLFMLLIKTGLHPVQIAVVKLHSLLLANALELDRVVLIVSFICQLLPQLAIF